METYKIAAVTEDGERLSSHFGMAPEYRVFTISGGQVQEAETRAKPHHVHHPQGDDHHHGHGGVGHADMFAPIADCQVLLVGGMGDPAYRKAQEAGLEVVLTGGSIQEVVRAYLAGELISDMRRVHRH